MSLILDQLAKTYDVSLEQTTELSAAVAAAGTVLTVNNTVGFSADDYIIIERVGKEIAEIIKIATVDSDTQLTVGAVNFAHVDKTNIFRVPYNQVKIYWSATESGTFAEIAANSPADMMVDQFYTYVIDTSGTASKWYKFSFYNETSEAESSLSAAVLAGKTRMICMLEDVRKDVGLKPEQRENDAKILTIIEQVTNEIINMTEIQYVSKSISGEFHDVDDEHPSKIYPDFYPIYGTPTVTDDGTDLDYDSDPDDTDFFYYDYMIVKDGTFTQGRRRVEIAYTAYREPPKEIVMVAIQMAAIRSGLKTRSFVDAEGVTNAVLLRSVPQDLINIVLRHKREPL